MRHVDDVARQIKDIRPVSDRDVTYSAYTLTEILSDDRRDIIAATIDIVTNSLNKEDMQRRVIDLEKHYGVPSSAFINHIKSLR